MTLVSGKYQENGFEIIEARMTDVIRKTYFYQDSDQGISSFK